jgi:hypothetical protein
MFFVALFEPRDVGHALSELSWVNVMHEELENFERNQVWSFIEPSRDVNVIGTKYGFKTNRGRMMRLWGTRLASLLKDLVRWKV